LVAGKWKGESTEMKKFVNGYGGNSRLKKKPLSKRDS